MANKKHRIGDIVCLKSGSQPMTVTKVVDVTCEVTWFYEGDTKFATIPAECLEEAKKKTD